MRVASTITRVQCGRFTWYTWVVRKGPLIIASGREPDKSLARQQCDFYKDELERSRKTRYSYVGV